MNPINRESEFLEFMESNGPQTKASRSNYISLLRYVSGNFFSIDESINEEKIERICIKIKETSSQRKEYRSDKDISNFRSVLKTYREFCDSKSFCSTIKGDLSIIMGHEISTSQKSEIEIRIGQGEYRKSLIKIWRGCSLTKYANTDFLVASHIKPWRESSPPERVDPYNGLLLKPNIDKLFDSGYISFRNGGEIIISTSLTDNDQLNMNISSEMKLYKVNEKHRFYLLYHRSNIFRV